MTRLLLFAALLALSLLGCQKGDDQPENSSTLDCLSKPVTGLYQSVSASSSVISLGGPQVPQPFTGQQIEIVALNCDNVHVYALPQRVDFQAALTQTGDNPVQVSGVSANGNASFVYNDATQQVTVTYTDSAAGIVYTFIAKK